MRAHEKASWLGVELCGFRPCIKGQDFSVPANAMAIYIIRPRVALVAHSHTRARLSNLQAARSDTSLH